MSPALQPRRALVRPRVLRSSSGEPVLLAEVVQEWLAHRATGAIALIGREGAGKTTALRDLAEQIDDPLLALRDETAPGESLVLDADRLTVYASANPHKEPNVPLLETCRLATWTDDDVIEYLLARAGDRAESVLKRALGDPSRGELHGSPMVWTAALDAMLRDGGLADLRAALLSLVARRVTGRLRRWLRVAAYNDLRYRLGHLKLASALQGIVADLPGLFRRVLAVPRVACALAAEHVIDCLCAGSRDVLRAFMPRALVVEVGQRLRDQRMLARVIQDSLLSVCESQPMAASLLLAADPDWRPASLVHLTRAWLDGARWNRIDLPSANLVSASLAQAQLAEANLTAALLFTATLTGACLRGAHLARSHAAHAVFRGATLAAADCTGAVFSRASFEDADLTGAKLTGCLMDMCNLDRARLAGADLSGALLIGATLEGTDLSGADLTHARFREQSLGRAMLQGARFHLAELPLCRLEGVALQAPDFRGAKLNRALLTGSSMPDADFRGADLAEAGLADVSWPRADLRGADLSRCTFHMGSSRSGLVVSFLASEGTRTGFYTDESLEGTFRAPEDVRKADLRWADLRGAKLEGSDFYLVDLRGAYLDADQIDYVRRCRAIL